MIEPMMFFALGALTAWLCALLFLPLVHARAVRLAARRLEDHLPVSLAQIRADKDLLRAEFAVVARRYEMTIEQLRARMAGQMAELGRKTHEINRLKLRLGEETTPAPEDRRDEVSTAVPAELVEPPFIRLGDLAKLAPDLAQSPLAPSPHEDDAPLWPARFEPAGPSRPRRRE
jgi:hypothetical protein